MSDNFIQLSTLNCFKKSAATFCGSVVHVLKYKAFNVEITMAP